MYVISDHVLRKQVGDEVVLLDMKEGAYFGLDALGVLVLDGLQRGLLLEQVVEEVLPRYDVAPETLRVDIQELVDDMLKRGLLARTDGPA